jgi:hypothetical protein
MIRSSETKDLLHTMQFCPVESACNIILSLASGKAAPDPVVYWHVTMH